MVISDMSRNCDKILRGGWNLVIDWYPVQGGVRYSYTHYELHYTFCFIFEIQLVLNLMINNDVN